MVCALALKFGFVSFLGPYVSFEKKNVSRHGTPGRCETSTLFCKSNMQKRTFVIGTKYVIIIK